MVYSEEQREETQLKALAINIFNGRVSEQMGYTFNGKSASFERCDGQIYLKLERD